MSTNNAMHANNNNNATAMVVYKRGGVAIGNNVAPLVNMFQRFIDLGCSTTGIIKARMVGSLATPATSALLTLNALQRIVSVPRCIAPRTPTHRTKRKSRRAPRKSFKREWVGALEVVQNLQDRKFPPTSRPARSTMRLLSFQESVAIEGNATRSFAASLPARPPRAPRSLSAAEIRKIEGNAARIFAVNPPARAPRASRSLSASEILVIEANAPTAPILEVEANAPSARCTVRALSAAEIAEALAIDAAIWEHASLRTVEVAPNPEP